METYREKFNKACRMAGLWFFVYRNPEWGRKLIHPYTVGTLL
jgi:hypothetical protein